MSEKSTVAAQIEDLTPSEDTQRVNFGKNAYKFKGNIKYSDVNYDESICHLIRCAVLCSKSIEDCVGFVFKMRDGCACAMILDKFPSAGKNDQDWGVWQI